MIQLSFGINNVKYKFLITGITGFIGSRLCDELLQDGHFIVGLTRQKNKISPHKNLIFINNLNEHEFNYDIIINLAGAPISVRWNPQNREEIYNSRLDITAEIVANIANAKNPPKTFISGSAIGYYGTSDNIIFSENSQPTTQNLFSQKICKDWENCASKAQKYTRVILLRTSVVIGKNGGIIKKLSIPFKLGFGGAIGSGAQFMSWIHIDDVMGIINLILNNVSIEGAINLSAPQVTTNKEFSKLLAKKYQRLCIFNVPSLGAKLVFGKMGEELLLSSQKIFPHKALENGYDFKYVNISDAIQNI
jgi:uncharacterized protein (TIGR01777 family)